MPLASQVFSSFHSEETWENGACEGTQAVLAILLANCPKGICVLYELRRVSYNT